MLSDGRLVERRIDRVACSACGLARHRRVPSGDEARAWYARGYALPAAAPAADAGRAEGYASWLCAQARDAAPRRILDVGAGSGALLHALARHFPDAVLTGCEPSMQGVRTSGRVTLHGGDVSALPEPRDADWIVSVNVIEHVPDPVALLRALAARLAPEGKLFVVAPEAAPPNLELLFVDHLWSFTTDAFARIAAAAGLEVTASSAAPEGRGDFRLHALRAASGKALPMPHANGESAARLARERAAYLRAWRDLDAVLLGRIGPGPIDAFGGGQMAALLRAYAPRTWERVDRLVVDDPAEAWGLGKPVVATAASQAARLLLSVAPATQAKLASRLAAWGRRTVRFDDVVAR